MSWRMRRQGGHWTGFATDKQGVCYAVCGFGDAILGPIHRFYRASH